MNMLNDSFRFTPHITLEFKIEEKDFFIAGESASRVKKTLQQLGIRQDIIKRTAIVIYEAAMNVAIHAIHGVLKVYVDPEVISVIAEDEGPGIENIELAMKEGYSTAPQEILEMGFGAGMGLPNIKQCSDELEIDTKVGVGTTLKAKIYVNKNQ